MTRITRSDMIKYTITCAIWLSYMKGGFVNGLLAPALVDFKYMLRTSMDSISLSYTFFSVGYLTGSLFGFVYKYLNRDLTFIVMTTLMVVSFGLMPLVTEYWMLYLCSFVTTLGSGAFDSGTYVWIIELWADKYEPILHTTQMMFGLATILAPIFMTPFVLGDVTQNMNQTMNDTTRDAINYAIERRPKLKTPFLICAGVTFLIPIILTIVFIAKKFDSNSENVRTRETHELSKSNVENSMKEKRELSPMTRNIMIGLVSVCLNCSTGLEYTHLFFSSAFYQNIPIHLSAQRAAQVLSVMSTAFTFGRIFAIIMSMKFRPAVMIIFHIIVICFALVIIYFGQNSEPFIFIGNAMIGFGNSALWPLFFAFTEQYLKLTDNITSIFLIVSMTFPMSTPFIVGPLIEKHNQVFIYTEFVYLITLIGISLVTLSMVKAFSFRSLMCWKKDRIKTTIELKRFSYIDKRSPNGSDNEISFR